MLGVLNEAPVKAIVVNAASLYQLNIGLVTVVLLAVSVAGLPEHAEVLAVVMSDASAGVVTFTVTALALAAMFSNLFAPFTVT